MEKGPTAPAGPAEAASVLLSSRAAGAEPPPSTIAGVEEPAKAAEAAELLSRFFDDIDVRDDDDEEPADPKVEATREQLQDTLAAFKNAVKGPIEYQVTGAPFVHVREAPSTTAASIGRLKQGTVVSGVPAGSWLYLTQEEVRKRQRKGRAVPEGGAWVLVESGDRAFMAPQWATVEADASPKELRLSWPGLTGSFAEYQVQWKPTAESDEAASPGQKDAGLSPKASLTNLPANTTVQVRVVARFGTAVELAGSWTDVKTSLDEEQEVQHLEKAWHAQARKELEAARQREAEEEQERKYREIQERMRAREAYGENEPGEKKYDTLVGGDTVARRPKDWEIAAGSGIAQGRGRGVFGTQIVPERCPPPATCFWDWSSALMWSNGTYPLACPSGFLGYGPEFPEDSRGRALLVQSIQPTVLLELNSVATFNMMDPDLSNDMIFTVDSAFELMKNPKEVQGTPLSYVVQGSGPHFCPGGNPNPKLNAGHTKMTTVQYVGYLPFVKCREFGVPGVIALHGSMVGGGVAYSLNVTMRVGTSNLTVAFGNASRGAVPGMHLSLNVPQTLGMPGGVDFYLADSTFSAFACLKAGYLVQSIGGNPNLKNLALTSARRLASTPLTTVVPLIKPPLDQHRFSWEAVAINLAGKSGEMFANLKQAKRVSAPKQEEPQQQAIEEYDDRPRRRTKRGARRR